MLRRRGGFTLTELMIAVVLVLFLTSAMGLIFGTTSRAIEKGEAVGEVTRKLDSVRSALAQDFTGRDRIDFDVQTDLGGVLPLSRQPAIIISSNYVTTWRNEEDADADADDWTTATTVNNWVAAALTADTDGDGTEDIPYNASEFSRSFALTGDRSFRTDQLTLGVAGHFVSQTGAGVNGFASEVTADHAMVYYGHLRVFNNNLNVVNDTDGYGMPGVPATGSNGGFVNDAEENVNNRFADQFILGRFALLLKESNRLAPVIGSYSEADYEFRREYIVDGLGNPVPFIRRSWTTPQDEDPNGGDNSVTPLSSGATAFLFNPTSNEVDEYQPNGATNPLRYGNVDIANVSASALRERLASVTLTDPATTGRGGTGTPVLANGRFPFREDDQWEPTDAQNRVPRPGFRNNSGAAWWEDWFYTDATRIWINPFAQSPLTAAGTAGRSHLLLAGAHSFVVEYAGDYFAQDPINGAPTALGPDGTLDFIVDPAGIRSVRFYGFPRDVDRDGDVKLHDQPGNANDYGSKDVLPLKDFADPALIAGAPNPLVFPHEKILPRPWNNGPINRITTYATRVNDPDYGGGDDTPPPYEGRYVCAWGPDELDGNFPAPFDFPLGPRLLRIVVTAVDGEGKLAEPLVAEYVFSLEP
jgi:prepilin-type N-terminal cleavage/methylation domain-containing protein